MSFQIAISASFCSFEPLGMRSAARTRLSCALSSARTSRIASAISSSTSSSSSSRSSSLTSALASRSLTHVTADGSVRSTSVLAASHCRTASKAS
eukprot:6358034-Prymnesium_polylepis.1